MHSVHASSSQLLKSFEVDSSHMPLSSEVKSNVIKSTMVDLVSFNLKSGHVSVPQRLAGLLMLKIVARVCVCDFVLPCVCLFAR